LIARSPEAALTGAFRPTATFTAAILTAAERLKCANRGHRRDGTQVDANSTAIASAVDAVLL
jgi:hypothetical protein